MIKRLLLVLILFAIVENCFSQKIVKKNVQTKKAKKVKVAYTKINKPNPIKLVNNFEGILTQNEKQTLDSIIRAFEKETSIEIVIVCLRKEHASKNNFDSIVLKNTTIGE